MKFKNSFGAVHIFVKFTGFFCFLFICFLLPLWVTLEPYLNLASYNKKLSYLNHLFATCNALQCCSETISGQEKKIEIQLPSGPVHFSFQLPPPKYYLPNRRREMFKHYQLNHLLGAVYCFAHLAVLIFLIVFDWN